jgi:hypothetical protein
MALGRTDPQDSFGGDGRLPARTCPREPIRRKAVDAGQGRRSRRGVRREARAHPRGEGRHRQARRSRRGGDMPDRSQPTCSGAQAQASDARPGARRGATHETRAPGARTRQAAISLTHAVSRSWARVRRWPPPSASAGCWRSRCPWRSALSTCAGSCRRPRASCPGRRARPAARRSSCPRAP